MKSIDDAMELRGRIFGAFEIAEVEADAAAEAAWLTFVVVGGGPTGVEMAGQLAELSRRSLHRNFATFDPAETKVILVEAAGGLLTSYGTKLSLRVKRDLERLGVDVRLDTMVVGVDIDGVEVKAAEGTPAGFRRRPRSGRPALPRRRSAARSRPRPGCSATGPDSWP